VNECGCIAAAIIRYQKRISGLLLDGIDIYLKVSRIDYEHLSVCKPGKPSEVIGARSHARG